MSNFDVIEAIVIDTDLAEDGALPAGIRWAGPARSEDDELFLWAELGALPPPFVVPATNGMERDGPDDPDAVGPAERPDDTAS